MLDFDRKLISQLSMYLELGILGLCAFTFFYWFTGEGLFYSETRPVLSPFTSISLGLLIIPRIAVRFTDTWSYPMTLALQGIVACGNASSLIVQLTTPELFLQALPGIVPTSAITSTGLILMACYEILVVLRDTPKTAFIVDDILLHLALFPGALSLLGHLAGVSVYMSSDFDPRVGVSILEMFLMASFVTVALITNPHLFLWRFLSRSVKTRSIFFLLFVNQYVTSFIFGIFYRPNSLGPNKVGVEFYIMTAGVLATLLFLVINALNENIRKTG